MTPTQYRAAIAQLGLSQERAGLWLGVSKRQGRRWASGESPIPKAVEMILNDYIEQGRKPEDVK